MSNEAHLLFPNDVPKSEQPPSAGSGPAAAQVPATGTNGGPASHAGGDTAKPDVASVLFKDDTVDRGAKAVTDILGGFANSAVGDGDSGERSRAIEAARDGLLADAKANGMDTGELASAMAIVKELQANSITEPTPEQAVQRMTEGLEACRLENISDADLDLGRRFVTEHLEKVAPGTVYTLERTGAGSDIRVIRAVIAEAKLRGYGR